jgi:hypothetical protein
VTVGEWLASRVPAPPPVLRARLQAALEPSLSRDRRDTADLCLRAGERLAETLLREQCTTRDSALDLLTADALVTYAFEAASESPADIAARASEAMVRIAALAATARSGATA